MFSLDKPPPLSFPLVPAAPQSKATEMQLRHRLENQVAEAESLRDELAAARQCADLAEASARAAEQRSRDGADESKKALLGEMETLMEEKLAAEARAGDMEGELGELRAAVASAEQRAAEEQSLVIKAAQERIAGLEQVAIRDRIFFSSRAYSGCDCKNMGIWRDAY